MSPAALSRGSGHQGSNLYINRLTFLLLFLAGFFFPQAEALNREDLFPFGEGAGDGTIFRNDDDFSLEICPSVPYSFYDRKISCFYVSFFVLLPSNSIILEAADALLLQIAVAYSMAYSVEGALCSVHMQWG